MGEWHFSVELDFLGKGKAGGRRGSGKRSPGAHGSCGKNGRDGTFRTDKRNEDIGGGQLELLIYFLWQLRVYGYLCTSEHNICLWNSKTEPGTMNELQLIRSKIYEIRGQKVMLDKDLAELYCVTTANLNKAVKRNMKRFPSDFMFQLNQTEFDDLKANLIFQNGTSNWGGTRKLPYAFTEQGLAMLSGLLNSDIAIQVNINIMRAFVAIRKMVTDNQMVLRLSTLEKNFAELKEDLEEIFTDYNDINEDTRMQLEAINITLAELQVKSPSKPRSRVGFRTEIKENGKAEG